MDRKKDPSASSLRVDQLENDVRKFMKLMKLEEPISLGSHPSLEVRIGRLRYIQEELSELAETMHEELSIDKVADALGDLLYVVVGTFLVYSIPIAPVWQEIQRSNMTKDPRIINGKKKGGKGVDYKLPKLKEVLGL